METHLFSFWGDQVEEWIRKKSSSLLWLYGMKVVLSCPAVTNSSPENKEREKEKENIHLGGWGVKVASFGENAPLDDSHYVVPVRGRKGRAIAWQGKCRYSSLTLAFPFPSRRKSFLDFTYNSFTCSEPSQSHSIFDALTRGLFIVGETKWATSLKNVFVPYPINIFKNDWFIKERVNFFHYINVAEDCGCINKIEFRNRSLNLRHQLHTHQKHSYLIEL